MRDDVAEWSNSSVVLTSPSGPASTITFSQVTPGPTWTPSSGTLCRIAVPSPMTVWGPIAECSTVPRTSAPAATRESSTRAEAAVRAAAGAGR